MARRRASFGVAAAGGSYANRRLSVGLRDAPGNFDYALDLNHFATDGYRDHSRAERTLFNAKANLGRGDTRLALLANALWAPNALDPLGLDRAQFDADPRQATAGAHSVQHAQVGHAGAARRVLSHDARRCGQLRALAYGGNRDVEPVPRHSRRDAGAIRSAAAA